MSDLCERTERAPDQCAHCLGIPEERPRTPGRPPKKPSGPTLMAAGGGVHEVVKLLPRPGGTVDVIVSYRPPGQKPRYAAYRHEPGGWRAYNDSWTDLDKAVAEVADLHRHAPLTSARLARLLSGVIEQSVEATA